MHLLDLTLPTLEANLALDEALLLDAEANAGPQVLRFWEWPRHAVVLGAGGKVGEEANVDACEAADIPIVRRSSGGGTVLLGRGCLLYSLILSYERDPRLGDLHASYRVILDRMSAALRPFAESVAWNGTSDLVVGDRKFSGNAQQRKRGHLLHHGTLLYDFDLAAISSYVAAAANAGVSASTPARRLRHEPADFRRKPARTHRGRMGRHRSTRRLA